MKHSIQVGFSFGSTSGVITVLGLISGLYFGTGSRMSLIAGIITIAIADSLSDSLGIHVSEESENVHSSAEIWVSTISTFFTKFVISSTFLIPVCFLDLDLSVIVSICWGLLLLFIFSYALGKSQSRRVFPIIFEHLSIAIIVVLLTGFVGHQINQYFEF
jgi:vacuolar iron transporter family protein